MSHYWPYLPMLLIVGLGLLVNSAWSDRSVLGTASDFSNATLLNSTNAERTKQGEPALTLDAELTDAAQAKANDMVAKNYWAHNAPDGTTPWMFITGAGYQYRAAGENLAYGFASGADTVAGWMNSPEHRANILNVSYQNVGFGVASSPDFVGEGPKTVIVAEYGQPAAAAAPAPADSNVAGVETAATPVSRIQLLGGDNSQWALLAVIVVSGAAMLLFILRHGYRVHRLVSRGEAFVVHHPYFDIAIVFLITAGILLTRSSGFIR
jgi:hypothetical protein